MIEESVKNADNGVQISKEVGTSLTEIGDVSRKVNDLVAEIAAASNEQAQGIEQISTAVGQMDTVTQQNAANAEESASASEELSAQAEELNKMVGELSAMVGGASGAANSAKAPKRFHADSSAPAQGGKRKVRPEDRMPGGAAHPRRQAVTAGSKPGPTPEDMIPMDSDKELAKF